MKLKSFLSDRRRFDTCQVGETKFFILIPSIAVYERFVETWLEVKEKLGDKVTDKDSGAHLLAWALCDDQGNRLVDVEDAEDVEQSKAWLQQELSAVEFQTLTKAAGRHFFVSSQEDREKK